jgi:hypothetical protein
MKEVLIVTVYVKVKSIVTQKEKRKMFHEIWRKVFSWVQLEIQTSLLVLAFVMVT